MNKLLKARKLLGKIADELPLLRHVTTGKEPNETRQEIIDFLLSLEEKNTVKVESSSGRFINVHGRPFIRIARDMSCEASPTEADALGKYFAETLDWNEFQKFYKKYLKS